MTDTYATLLSRVSVSSVASEDEQGSGTSIAPLRDTLDTESLRRASMALASELDLQGLVAKLMTILVQNAGAERGVLLRAADGQLTVEASASTSEGGVEVNLGGDASDQNGFSAAIVRYVLRSRESVAVGDAMGDDRFANDAYVARARPKSVLSAPIVQRGDVLAVLYLENNHICNAFAEDHLNAVEHIASYAAAALANARLHDELKRAFTEIKGRSRARVRISPTRSTPRTANARRASPSAPRPAPAS